MTQQFEKGADLSNYLAVCQALYDIDRRITALDAYARKTDLPVGQERAAYMANYFERLDLCGRRLDMRTEAYEALGAAYQMRVSPAPFSLKQLRQGSSRQARSPELQIVGPPFSSPRLVDHARHYRVAGAPHAILTNLYLPPGEVSALAEEQGLRAEILPMSAYNLSSECTAALLFRGTSEKHQGVSQ